MNIIWAQNPLRTKVELNDLEIKLFSALYAKEHIEEALYSTYFSLKEGNIERALRRCEPSFLDGNEGKDRRREWIEANIKIFLDSLGEAHCGDCTCFAASCTKCYIEHELDIDTIAGLGKHEADYIQSAFRLGKKEGDETPYCAQAIEYLEDNPPKIDPSKGWQEPHLERWKGEHARALEWLKNYFEEKISGRN
jgi:hypothetical protein